jgi:hypothetical protein
MPPPRPSVPGDRRVVSDERHDGAGRFRTGEQLRVRLWQLDPGQPYRFPLPAPHAGRRRTPPTLRRACGPVCRAAGPVAGAGASADGAHAAKRRVDCKGRGRQRLPCPRHALRSARPGTWTVAAGTDIGGKTVGLLLVLPFAHGVQPGHCSVVSLISVSQRRSTVAAPVLHLHGSRGVLYGYRRLVAESDECLLQFTPSGSNLRDVHGR